MLPRENRGESSGGTPPKTVAPRNCRNIGSSMTDLYSNAQSAADYIRTATDLAPHIGIILGSGLGNFANHVRGATTATCDANASACACPKW